MPDHDSDKAEKPAAPREDGWSGQVTRLIAVIQTSPYAAVLAVGLLIIIAAFIRKLGSFELVAEGSQGLTVTVGAFLCGIGLLGPVLTSRKAQRTLAYIGGDSLPQEAQDVEFMFKVFYLGMPPAFVKRVVTPGADPGGGDLPEATDILYSKELDRFQRSDLTRAVAEDDRRRLIKEDHRCGDEQALRDTWSVQLEYPDSYVNGQLFPILTYKTRFEHKGQVYIAGWYIPVELPDVPADAEAVTVREQVGQLLFRPVLARKSGGGSRVMVGKALRTFVKGVE